MTSILAAYLKQSTFIIRRVYNSIFIDQCVFCLSTDPDNICTTCQAALPRLGLHCPQCAQPNHHGHVCGECLQHPPAFDRVICPFMLQGAVASLIQKLKRKNKVLGLECLESNLSELLQRYEFDAIVAVPYHWRKLLWRGHHPTGQLTRALSKTLHTPQWQGLLRTKATQSQQGLDKTARQSNVRRAFTCSPHFAQQIKGKNLLLVDDVLTTGATSHAAALVLKKHGAKSVTLACLARTPLEH